MEKDEKLVAVYGSLREGMHNNGMLGKSEYIGSFNSEPSYTMFSVNDQYPAVINEGSTSILLEVYKTNPEVQKKLNFLEGYHDSKDTKHNYYNRETIETPYGDAYIYYFNNDTSNCKMVESGDWSSWMAEKEKIKSEKIYNEWGY
jgi:gamma-glutamylcyclotransferase (GGCT)/AIG2-like uncharacterized protein YtfP